MGKQKKTRAQRNAIRKQGLKEIGQGYKQWLIDGSKKAAMGAVKGAFDGAIAGDGVADKVAKGAVSAAKAGIGGAIKDVAQGTWKASKGIFKAIFNDLDWYTNYPDLVKGMAGANFATDNSTLMTYTAKATSPDASKAQISIHQVALANGSSEKVRHMAVQKIFESVRRANSGSVNYTESQINSYYIVIRNIVALASELRRAYGVANYYTSANLSIPNAYLQALGFNAADIISNQANIRNYLKLLNRRLGVYVPLSLPVIARTEWMFSNMFMDSNDVKAQPHCFVLTHYLHNNASNTWGVTVKSPFTLLTFTQFVQLIEDELAALVRVCPAGIIAGDMLKAFGVSALYNFGDTAEDYTVPRGYSEEVLTQIQNLVHPYKAAKTAAADAYGLEYMKITTASCPTTTSSSLGAVFVHDMNEPQINMYKDDISNADIIGATRLVVAAQSTITSASTNFDLCFGTEVVLESTTFYLTSSGLQHDSLSTYTEMTVANIDTVFTAVRNWSHMDWSPRANIQFDYYDNNGGVLRTSVTDIWDYNNAGFLSIRSTETLHEIAYASMYYVPLLTRAANNLVVVEK